MTETQNGTAAAPEHKPTIPREDLIKILEVGGFDFAAEGRSNGFLAGAILAFAEVAAAEARNLKAGQDDGDDARGYLTILVHLMREHTPEMQEVIIGRLLAYGADRLGHLLRYYHGEAEHTQRRAMLAMTLPAVEILRRVVACVEVWDSPENLWRQLRVAASLADGFSQGAQLGSTLLGPAGAPAPRTPPGSPVSVRVATDPHAPRTSVEQAVIECYDAYRERDPRSAAESPASPPPAPDAPDASQAVSDAPEPGEAVAGAEASEHV